MNNHLHVVRFLICIIALLICDSANSQDAPDATEAPRKLIVATKEAPPFAIKGDDGVWKGLSIDLWRQIADQLDVDYEFKEMTLDEMLQSMRDKKSDVAVAGLTVTNQRERDMDFTHSFHISGLGIAVAPEKSSSPLSVVFRVLFSWQFIEIVFGLLLVLLAVGFLIWCFERRKNRDHFGGSTAKGLASGFWWSAVTMTTVGYGDKAPITLAGRLLAIFWMFLSLFMISFFTASVASLVLVDQLESHITGLKDLPGARVGTLPSSTSEAFLHRQRVKHRRYDSALDALEALRDGKVDAVVYDAPMLRYTIEREFRDELAVLPIRFETQSYSIALPSGSDLREPVNQALLDITSEPEWQNTLYRYLGE